MTVYGLEGLIVLLAAVFRIATKYNVTFVNHEVELNVEKMEEA